MARRGINAPFPIAPLEYSAGYMNRIIQTYSSLLAQLQTPGELRGTALTLTRLPTAEGSLADGTVYRDGETLKIADGVNANLRLSMGTVTVYTSSSGVDVTVEITGV